MNRLRKTLLLSKIIRRDKYGENAFKQTKKTGVKDSGTVDVDEWIKNRRKKEHFFAILKIIGSVIGIAVLLFLSWSIAPMLDAFGGIRMAIETVFLLFFVLDFVVAIKNLITVLYMSSDLTTLIAMPFTPLQIVTARIWVASSTTLIFNVACLVPIGVGLAMGAGLGFEFYLGTALGAILVPLTAISIVLSLVVILMRFVGAIRNKNLMKTLSAIITFIIIVGTLWLRVKLSGTGEQNKIFLQESLGAASGVSSFVPSIAKLSDFMANGNWVSLLIVLAIALVTVAIATFLVSKLYFRGAMGMQESSVKQKALTKGELAKKSTKKNWKKSYLGKEFKMIWRNPAYLITGFLLTYLWPVLFVVVLLANSASLNINIEELKNSIDPEKFNSLVAIIMMVVGSAIGIFSASFNSLAWSSFSREGSSFSKIKEFPLSYREQIGVKRKLAFLICLIPSLVFTLIVGIVATNIGIMPFWMVIPGMVFAVLAELFAINMEMISGIKHINLSWSSESELARKSGNGPWIMLIAIVVLIAVLAGTIILNIMYDMINIGIAVAFAVILLALYILVIKLSARRMYNLGEKRIEQLY